MDSLIGVIMTVAVCIIGSWILQGGLFTTRGVRYKSRLLYKQWRIHVKVTNSDDVTSPVITRISRKQCQIPATDIVVLSS